MRAVVFDRPGGPEVLAVRDVEAPVPGASEVLIEVGATALNRPDLLQRRGLYPPPPGASDILGLECAGVVTAVGSGTSAVRVGDKVMALLAGGGYAEQVSVPERQTLPIPVGLDVTAAAAIPETFLTAFEALFNVARLAPAEWVLVHAAAGGVGSAAVQLAKASGARVIATTSGGAKADLVRALGADLVVDYRSEDFAAAALEASEGSGVDVIVDLIGAAYSEAHSRCLAIGGRHVLVGLLGGAKASLDLGRLLTKRQTLTGFVMRPRSLADKAAIVEGFRRRFLPLFETGRLRPVLDSVYPLKDVILAHERMEANLNLGKIVLCVS
jgi:putative PIG3 family NAD(P)H quinone oxidoreductase